MAEWKKVVVSGSDISQLNNDANYLINGQSGASLTGSFSGSFVGTTNLPDLTSGEGISTFTYDGSGTAIVAVSGAVDLSNNAVTKWNDTDGKFANSSLTDNGTSITGTTSIQLTGVNSILSGSFSGSFQGNGSGLTNIPASGITGLNLSMIATGSVTASVNVGTNAFTIVSGSTTLHNIRANGGFEHGLNVTASGDWSHAEGDVTLASGSYSHAEGRGTTASGYGSHAEGNSTIASGPYSHAEGNGTTASGYGSHAEGSGTTASGDYSHAEGKTTTASGLYSHAEGSGTTASGDYSHAEGENTIATGFGSHAEGNTTIASGSYSHAEGHQTIASGSYSHAEGSGTTASGYYSHAEGFGTTASGNYSHAEGSGTTASGYAAHAEGTVTTASGYYSHAEGNGTTASGNYSHAEGFGTIASGNASHAEGLSTIASGYASHAEGNGTTASGSYSHAEGIGTIASGSGQLAAGKYNTHNNTDSLVVIGNGANDSTRSDLALFNPQSITFNQPVTGSIFTGSFVGDGSGLTGVTATAGFALSQSTGITAFSYNGSATAVVQVSGSAGLSSNTITKWTGAAFADTSITDDGALVTISNDALFTGDITVQGTASFQNTQNLLVSDRFVLFASGSNTTGDGGIVVQQGTQNVGELFGYNSSATRWGFTSSFAADGSTFTPAVYVGAVQTGTGQTAASAAPIYGGASFGYGTIHVDTDDSEIWIYA